MVRQDCARRVVVHEMCVSVDGVAGRRVGMRWAWRLACRSGMNFAPALFVWYNVAR